MSKINKITRLYPSSGNITDEDIQAHFDAQNEDGWYLVNVDNMVGWYRFFGKKKYNEYKGWIFKAQRLCPS